MKLKPLASILAAIALAGGTIATRPEPSAAQSNRYFCAESADGVFTTFAQIPNGDRIPVIRWERKWGGEYTREIRCRQVSPRFQEAESQGVLKYITSGQLHGYNVICATEAYGGHCRKFLFTIRSADDHNEVIKELIGVGYRTQGPISQSDDGPPRLL
ncbi:MAG: hypothetical protein GDA56_07520 [Hormoscilla sp. GM7CHS1pb]|nr:hypothetical protein [Hormoscilla sp. GM7CHS1pb]